jgi:hypothetical protein
MSEQEQDFNSFQEHLERIFKDLDDGMMLTADEIGDLRYACGLPSPVRNTHVNPVLLDVINDFGNCFGNPLNNFPKIWSKK